MQVMLKRLQYIMEQFWIQAAISKISTLREAFIAKQKDGLTCIMHMHYLVCCNIKNRKLLDPVAHQRIAGLFYSSDHIFHPRVKLFSLEVKRFTKEKVSCSRTDQQHSIFGPIGDQWVSTFPSKMYWVYIFVTTILALKPCLFYFSQVEKESLKHNQDYRLHIWVEWTNPLLLRYIIRLCAVSMSARTILGTFT